MSVVEVLILIVVLYILMTVLKLEGKVNGLKTRLAEISKHVGIKEEAVHPEIKSLVEHDEEIKAVKRARELYGLSLVEAKEYVDKIKNDEEKI